MRAKLLGAALAALLIPAAMMVSWAGELPKQGKIAAPVASASAQDNPSWTGFHLDGSVGYGFTRTEFEAISGGGTLDKQNVLVSAGMGYDLQLSNIVLGVMADVTASHIDDPRWQWFAGVRGGVLLTPRTLAYGLVGYTEDIDGKLAFQSVEVTNIKDLAGLTVGGGLEHQFAQGWSAKAEYRYVSFGREHAPDGVIDGLVDGSSIDSGEHQVRLGLSKRF